VNPSSTYSDTKQNETVKPIRASSSNRNYGSKELSIGGKTPQQRPLTSTLVDLLDENLSDFEGIEDFEDTIQKIKLEEAIE